MTAGKALVSAAARCTTKPLRAVRASMDTTTPALVAEGSAPVAR